MARHGQELVHVRGAVRLALCRYGAPIEDLQQLLQLSEGKGALAIEDEPALRLRQTGTAQHDEEEVEDVPRHRTIHLLHDLEDCLDRRHSVPRLICLDEGHLHHEEIGQLNVIDAEALLHLKSLLLREVLNGSLLKDSPVFFIAVDVDGRGG